MLLCATGARKLRVVSQSGFILPKSLFVGACRRLIAGLVLDAAFLWLPGFCSSSAQNVAKRAMAAKASARIPAATRSSCTPRQACETLPGRRFARRHLRSRSASRHQARLGRRLMPGCVEPAMAAGFLAWTQLRSAMRTEHVQSPMGSVMGRRARRCRQLVQRIHYKASLRHRSSGKRESDAGLFR